jgi:SpoVK/Ycf46/Vps4 family AAA+-type ATPase
VIGSELIQKYVGEGARMVRELFQVARSKKACIVFFDEVDAIGGSRDAGGSDGSDSEVQRTMLEIVNQLDGFDARGNVKVLMATNRPDTLDPALLRPGRLDRKVEFSLPELEGRMHIFKIHAKSMAVEKGIRWELLARLCPSTTGAELRSVCTEAGMFCIRARRKAVCEKDFLDAITKVIKGHKKFSATAKYMVRFPALAGRWGWRSLRLRRCPITTSTVNTHTHAHTSTTPRPAPSPGLQLGFTYSVLLFFNPFHFSSLLRRQRCQWALCRAYSRRRCRSLWMAFLCRLAITLRAFQDGCRSACTGSPVGPRPRSRPQPLPLRLPKVGPSGAGRSGA